MKKQNRLLEAMIAYYSGDPKRIQHFLKVYSFARLIGEEEGLDARTQEILETAAIVHDIGIKSAEQLYHSADGKYQEELGPNEARKMLMRLDYDADLIDRVSYLVGHHHIYTDIQGADYQILVESDFLVNLYEDTLDENACYHAMKRIFRTEIGRKLLQEMFGLTLQKE